MAGKVKTVKKVVPIKEEVKAKADCPLCGGKGVNKEDEQCVCPCVNS